MIPTDEQWLLLEPLLPASSASSLGRPRLDRRAVLGGIFTKIISASPWYDLPLEGLSWQTCYSCHRLWARRGVMEQVVHTMYRDLSLRGGFDLQAALDEKRILVVPAGGRRFLVLPDPDLRPTWQLSTALIVTRYFLDQVLQKIRSAH